MENVPSVPEFLEFLSSIFSITCRFFGRRSCYTQSPFWVESVALWHEEFGEKGNSKRRVESGIHGGTYLFRTVIPRVNTSTFQIATANADTATGSESANSADGVISASCACSTGARSQSHLVYLRAYLLSTRRTPRVKRSRGRWNTAR
jgi:hypothetical protein